MALKPLNAPARLRLAGVSVGFNLLKNEKVVNNRLPNYLIIVVDPLVIQNDFVKV